MNRRIHNTSVWVGLLVALGAFFPAILLIPRQELFEVLNAVIMALGVGIIVAAGPEAWRTMRMPVRTVTGGQVLLVGIVLAAVATVQIFGTQWLWRVLGKPDYLIDGWFSALGRWLLWVACCICLAATQSSEGMVGVHSYRAAALWAIAAVLIASMLISLGYR